MYPCMLVVPRHTPVGNLVLRLCVRASETLFCGPHNSLNLFTLTVNHGFKRAHPPLATVSWDDEEAHKTCYFDHGILFIILQDHENLDLFVHCTMDWGYIVDSITN